MINYNKILNQNMINVFKDILNKIKSDGLQNNNHLYVTFFTNHKKNKIANWLKEKYPDEMTIIIQYEYFNINIFKDYFLITLSFNDIKTDLKIFYETIISFADPSANFGLKLKNEKPVKEKVETVTGKKVKKSGKILSFSSYKKTNLNKND